MREILFAGIGSFTVLMAACVVFARSPVYSAFSLVLSFFGLASLYVLWDATFIAMIQILIYAGAIVVLFVFVVMLLNLGQGSGPLTYGWPTILISAAAPWFLCLLFLRLLNGATLAAVKPTENPVLHLRGISLMLFNEYLWPFEVLSLFLLALIVAIFVLARPDSEEGAQ